MEKRKMEKEENNKYKPHDVPLHNIYLANLVMYREFEYHSSYTQGAA